MSQSLQRALDLLSELAKGPATLDQLSTSATVHKTTVMRLLHSLEERSFVVRDGQQRYRLGSALFALANLALEQRDVISAAHGHLARLNQSTGHTIHLAALEGEDVVYVDKLESRHPVRMYSRVGLRAPLHATAVAKIILADLSEAERDRLLEGTDWRRFTDGTITDPALFEKELNLVSAQGWALDDQEHESFVHCVAAPVRDATGRVVAAVSTSVPVVMLDKPGLLALVPEVRACADAISADLGHLPD